MEIRDLREKNFDTIEAVEEWHRYPGTNFELQMVELSPSQWEKINRECSHREFDKKAKQHFDKLNNRKSTEMAFHMGLHGCRGLTPHVIKESFKLTWPFPDPEDEQITFSSNEVMRDAIFFLAQKSTRLKRFVVDRIIPDMEVAQDEEEAFEAEKKIS